MCGTQFIVEFWLTNQKIWRLIELELSLKSIRNERNALKLKRNREIKREKRIENPIK